MADSIITVSLNKLQHDPLNVRKTYSEEAIADLAASIEANGILQNLVGRRAKAKGAYYVSAGGRRLRALLLLVKQGKLAADYPVLLREITEAEAQEMSLTENIMREGMNPADQFEAFRDLADKGKSIEEIAIRFGTTETIVKKRLALGRVAPELRDLFRKEEMNLETLSAFTITDDHEEQIRVWKSLPSHRRDGHSIRQALAGEVVRATDKRMKFIGGLDAYEAAGGQIKRDLFDVNGGYAMDGALVDRLVAEKMAIEAESLKAAGWKWVDMPIEMDYQAYSKYGRIYPKSPTLSPEDQEKLARLSEQYDALAAIIEEGDGPDDVEMQLAQVEEQINLIQGQRFDPEELKTAGVVCSLAHDGNLRYDFGLIRPEDKAKSIKSANNEGSEAESDDLPTGPVLKHSATLLEDLTAQKTAALMLEMANNADIALAAVVHALLLQTVYSGYVSSYTSLEIRLNKTYPETSLKNPEANTALECLSAMTETFKSAIPANPADLFDWCLDQKRDDLLKLLAFAASHSVNVVQGKVYEQKRLDHGDQLGRALAVDMGKYFKPTAETYFSHLNRQGIEAAVTEAKGAAFAEGIAGMKKAEAAAFAERQVENSGWLPRPILFADAPVVAPSDSQEPGVREEDNEEDNEDDNPMMMAAE
ncbi:ParB/RepB/Spo0J family partition protein [Allorhizobium sp. BGMRC 0089]|uniref:ParB/RepB/Spo0J family partition protein n=1 Tax=Allorhizobium sonneratiae TaxID=2934936 RepID=UPI0020333679|nr:ParB/RepB/Spo0J family partition protein [Allorhizobium sonneratiae]MCM2294801.1 ParB/RepB/Spo0J family partition protein [Allorhizobium sonneratiae]